MDVFWCITLSVLVVRYWWKHQHFKPKETPPKPGLFDNLSGQKTIPNRPKKEKTEEEKRQEKDIADLKRQGYDDELIAVIIPTINNGQ